MSPLRIAIIGGGAAGTAAAWAARRAGADVTLWVDRAGATSLYSGALDLLPWAWNDHAAPVDSDLLAFATSLDAWSLGAEAAWVATHEGLLRPARGIDTALLDLAGLTGQLVCVAAPALEDWNARSLAASLEPFTPLAAGRANGRAKERGGPRFEAVTVVGIFDPGESHYSTFDRAGLHDSKERVARLAECLSRARPRAAAWLLGPWLGTVPGAAERLRSVLDKPCGETTSGPGGPAGARFEASRDVLLSNLGVTVRRGHVDAFERRSNATSAGALFVLESPAPLEMGFDAVILATGGLIGGGIELTDGGTPATVAGFRSSVRGPLPVGLGHRVFDRVSSLHGFDLAAQGPKALERVGIVAEGNVVRGAPAVFVAGDCVEGRPRTALAAASSGIAAARRALER